MSPSLAIIRYHGESGPTASLEAGAGSKVVAERGCSVLSVTSPAIQAAGTLRHLALPEAPVQRAPRRRCRLTALAIDRIGPQRSR